MGKAVKNPEYESFNAAMNTILRADPKAVKDAMEAEKKANAKERKAKGERKRGKHSDKSK